MDPYSRPYITHCSTFHVLFHSFIPSKLTKNKSRDPGSGSGRRTKNLWHRTQFMITTIIIVTIVTLTVCFQRWI